MKRSLRYDPHELRAPYQRTNRISSKTLDVMGLNKIDLDQIENQALNSSELNKPQSQNNYKD